MGCMTSKPADAGDKEALQRNARIDRVLKTDKKTLDRTIKILLLGMCHTFRLRTWMRVPMLTHVII